MRHGFVAALFLLSVTARCETVPKTHTDCDVAAAGKVIAFFQGEPKPPGQLQATVEKIVPVDSSTGYTYELRDEAGTGHRLTWRASNPMPGIIEGRAYDFRVEFVGGFPPASSIVVSDRRGILFVAVTDQEPGQHVLKGGVGGFELALADAGCPSRKRDPCYDGIFNMQLRISRNGRAVALMNGQSAVVDGYRARVLVAQKVIYNKRCADAGLDGISYTIAREE